MSTFQSGQGSLKRGTAYLADTNWHDVVPASQDTQIVEYFRAVLTTNSATTTLQVEVYDGVLSTAIRPDKLLAAHDVYVDRDFIVLDPGEVLRAKRGAGADVHVTAGVTVLST